jgi:hypothetical protein
VPLPDIIGQRQKQSPNNGVRSCTLATSSTKTGETTSSEVTASVFSIGYESLRDLEPHTFEFSNTKHSSSSILDIAYIDAYTTNEIPGVLAFKRAFGARNII